MTIEILLPRLGWSMEQGTFGEWLKRDGDMVQPGDLLYTVESDKALNEVEAMDGGILRIAPDAPAPGAVIPVGALLGYIVQPGEVLPQIESEKREVKSQTSDATKEQPQANSTSHVPLSTSDFPNISPRARRVAGELGVDWQSLTGSGQTGRIVERDVRAAHTAQSTRTAMPASATGINASPIARRMATELGVDLGQLAVVMPNKRIERSDVERTVEAHRTQQTSEASVTASPAARNAMTGVRRITAEHMAASARTTAPVTLMSEVDATELVRLRKQLKADKKQPAQVAPSRVPSYTDLLAKICAVALKEHPSINARLEGNEIVVEPAIHIGIAVDTERGLLVPVIRAVHAKSLLQISVEAETLIARARDGKLTSDELRGSTFTVTNLGMYDIDAFTPIIHLPECAILGMGRIVPKQVVMDAPTATVAIRHMMTLSLTFDHRLVDGAPAARFLQRVKQLVEQPYLWLVS